MRVLFLSRWFPFPPTNGSKLRIYNQLCQIAQQHEVTLLSFAEQSEIAAGITVDNSCCVEVHTVPWQPYNRNSWEARLGYFRRKPRSIIDTFSPEMAESIHACLTKTQYDLVIASQIDMAAYGHYFRGLPAIFEEAELGVLYERFVRSTSWHSRLRNGLAWLKYRYYLADVVNHFRLCTVVSEQEKSIFKNTVVGYDAVEVIPNGVDVASYTPVHAELKPNTLIFTGAFSYNPNHEAMVWFLSYVYPLIQAEIPDVSLTITGDHKNLPLPPATNVTLTGFVDDIRPLIKQSWLSVVPLFTGGGTRLKILESMALQTPVVATPKGAEGLDARDGQHLLIADTAETFAQHVIQVLKDRALRSRLADNAYHNVREKYDWNTIMPHFLTLMAKVVSS